MTGERDQESHLPVQDGMVGTLDRFNNAKRAEEQDRVKHGAGGIPAGRSSQKG